MKKKGMKLLQWLTTTEKPTEVVEPIEVYQEGEHTVKKYPPNPAWAGGPTAKAKQKAKRSDR